jgi:glycosyltransferase involved in cell wall biosynthesis
MTAATAVAVPSLWYENHPMVVLEAFAFGTPVVSTDLGGLPELVRSGATGATVPAGNAPALGRVLAALVADPDRASMLGANARRLVGDEFSPQRHLERVRTVYAEAGACVDDQRMAVP